MALDTGKEDTLMMLNKVVVCPMSYDYTVQN